MPYGRPLKGKSRRTPITVHSSVGMLDAIDEYVEERGQSKEGAYSRSVFFNEAACFYLQHLGREPDGEEVRAKRNKNVTGKNREPSQRDNTDNSHNEGEQK